MIVTVIVSAKRIWELFIWYGITKYIVNMYRMYLNTINYWYISLILKIIFIQSREVRFYELVEFISKPWSEDFIKPKRVICQAVKGNRVSPTDCAPMRAILRDDCKGMANHHTVIISVILVRRSMIICLKWFLVF